MTGLLDELPSAPLLLLVAFRDLPVNHREPFLSFLGSFRQRAAVRESRLGNLPPQEAAAFLESLLGAPPSEALLAEVLRLTGGNPLFIRETARLCRGRLEADGRLEARVCVDGIPQAVGAAVALRSGRLSASSRDALATAAVIGERFRLEELRLALPEAGAEGLEAVLEEAAAHGFLEHGEEGEEYRFSHALVHEAIRREVPAGRRRATCARLAAGIEQAHATRLSPWALRLAGWWAEAGGAEGTTNARRCTRLAAERAIEEGAWEQAIGLFRRLLGPAMEEACSEEEAAELLFGLGRACFQSGERTTGFRHLRRAFSWFRANGRVERLVQIATLPAYLTPGTPASTTSTRR